MDSILEIKKQHFSAYHWPSSGLILEVTDIDIDIFVTCNWVCHPVAVHIYTQTIHRMIQNKQYIEQHNKEVCGPCPVLASITLAFALQLRKSTEKPQSG